jgi:predicted transcriptional regulator
MTKKDLIVEYLKENLTNSTNGFVSPTDIGMNVLDKMYTSASSAACYHLKDLLKDGIVERNKKGLYKLRSL